MSFVVTASKSHRCAVYPKSVFNKTIKTRLSNSFFIGEIVGQLLLGATIDRIGRKAGVLMTTLLLILGVILSAASHGSGQGTLLIPSSFSMLKFYM